MCCRRRRVRELMNAIEPKPLSLFNARELKYRDFLTVVLIGRPQKELPDNWVYIHDPSVKVGRVQNFRSWSPEMIADGVSTCLGLEYFCFEGDGVWSSPDSELIELAKNGDRQDRADGSRRRVRRLRRASGQGLSRL